MFRPLDPSDPSRRTRRRLLVGIIALAAAGVGAATWTAWQASRLGGVVERMRADGLHLQAQLKASDLRGAAATATRLRGEANRARSLTSGPRWAVAAHLPGVGREVHAVRAVTRSVAEILDAAQPLEGVLPRLDPRTQKAAGGRVDVEALARAAAVLPAVSQAVDAASSRMQVIDPMPLQSSVGSGVRTLQSVLGQIRGPLDGAAATFEVIPTMLGAHRPQTYAVLLEQDAEARGTGGLVGSFAVVRAHQGALSLVQAQSRGALDKGPAIPVSALPGSLQELWGTDLTEWAGLNLSPHFPWTGQLVASGWAAQRRTPELDYVVGIDAYVVAALLAGTGPVSVDGITLDSTNTVQVLSRDIYARIADPARVDRATAGLVHEVFDRISAGKFSLAPIVAAMIDPALHRRLTIWAADPAIEGKLAGLSIGGSLPDTPGPFAMAVVNNGGGNKLDAYLSVATAYDPGPCEENVRLGHITVTLTNTAPRRGLPDYVSARTDLAEEHRPNPVVGSNRLILDVYGPVGATSPLANLDGEGVPVTAGIDRNHPVWRVIVPINPGQTRTVDVLVVDPVINGISKEPTPVVLAQPMAIPATATAAPRLSSCAAD